MGKSMDKTKYSDKAREVMCLNSHITILDNTSALIENCKQIVECNEILVKILTGKYEVEVWGSELSLSNYCNSSVEVNGRIDTVNITSKKSGK